MKKSSRGEEGIQRVRGLKPWRWRFFRSAILPTRRIFTAHSRNGIYCDILMGIGLYRAVNWWLRSPNSSDYDSAYSVITDGSVNNDYVYNGDYCARPALAGKYAEIR